MVQETKYYYVIGSKQFLLTEEPLEEVLRERLQHYYRTNKGIDFWLLPSPEFLNCDDMVEIKKNCPKSCLAIVSTNKVFITWLKLRLNNVISGEIKFPKPGLVSPLAYNNA